MDGDQGNIEPQKSAESADLASVDLCIRQIRAVCRDQRKLTDRDQIERLVVV